MRRAWNPTTRLRFAFFCALIRGSVVFGDVVIDNWTEKPPSYTLTKAHASSVNTFAWYTGSASASFNWAVSGSTDADGGVRVWGGDPRVGVWATTAVTTKLFGNARGASIDRLIYSPLGNAVASTADDYTLRVWGVSTAAVNAADVRTWSPFPVRNYTSGAGPFCPYATAEPLAAWSADGKFLAVACSVADWSVSPTSSSTASSMYVALVGGATDPNDATWAPANGKNLHVGWVTGSGGNALYRGVPSSVAWHPNGAYFVVGFMDSYYQKEYVQPISVSAAGALTVNAAQQLPKAVSSLYTSTSKKVRTTPPASASFAVRSLSISPVQVASKWLMAYQQDLRCFTQVLAVGTSGAFSSTWPSAPLMSWNLDGLENATAVAWSPQASYLAVSCSDAYVRVFETSGWTMTRTFNTNGGLVYAVAFSGNAEYLAAAVASASVILYGGCSPGSEISGFTASSTCNPCAAGAVSSYAGQQCAACSAGTYQPSAGMSGCMACGKGNTSATPSSCSACAAGRVGANAINPSCDYCDVGQAQPLTGKTRCNLCSAGSFANVTGQSNCFQCELAAQVMAAWLGAVVRRAAAAAQCTSCVLVGLRR